MINFEHIFKDKNAPPEQQIIETRSAPSSALASGKKQMPVEAKLVEVVNEVKEVAELSVSRSGKEGTESGIIESRFCIGCTRSSVDRMGCKNEAWYCMRNEDVDGVVVFVRIKEEVTVGQCIYRVEG